MLLAIEHTLDLIKSRQHIIEGIIMSERFEDSPEYEDWIEETGGRDEERSDYYNKWMRRKQRES